MAQPAITSNVCISHHPVADRCLIGEADDIAAAYRVSVVRDERVLVEVSMVSRGKVYEIHIVSVCL